MDASPKPVELVKIAPPLPERRVRRDAVFASDGERRNRYHLPKSLDSHAPVGYRTRPNLTAEEGEAALRLLAMTRPTGFAAPAGVRERALFEECALGIMVARQSTNYRGHREVVLGPEDSGQVAEILRGLDGIEAPVLDGSTHTHVVLSRPYRTPFTLLLTVVGHLPVLNLLTVPWRIWQKRVNHADDIPTIGYLQDLHVGILADAMERAAVLASGDTRRANVFMAPFCGRHRQTNKGALRRLGDLVGLRPAERRQGWRVAIVGQVGEALPTERVGLTPGQCRRLGATLVALRSERIQPGVNHEEKAPPAFHDRQGMDVPDELTVMCGRAAYNAFTHWTGCDREWAKEHVLLERIDVLTPGGKERLRSVRKQLHAITDRVVKFIPLWADLPTGKALSRNALRGKKAFALAGQRIYVGGLSRPEIAAAGIDWDLSVRAFGALASRSALVAELMGCVDRPADCDLLAGICLMAGPVNQNDIGKSFYGYPDLLAEAFEGRDPTSLLVWTLKAKTVADPIGNEEQLLNARRKGALVDLRPGPHEVVTLRRQGRLEPMRRREGRVNTERAFAEEGNFVTDPEGREIPGNRGSAWPAEWSEELLWGEP
ncbi:MAG: hypothetical protein QF464_02530 [Myxococcota bacterium]|nr:hypothetical protein [Myxococcota bacterium]